jgi:phosphatidylserine/phosphatidylglycerophosphate/cardiolipin synthase-like enzyme
VRRVRFSWPAGFDDSQCRFWVSGLDGRIAAPFGARRDKTLVVSPFLSNPAVTDFLDNSQETHLVSRQESLQDLPRETLRRCKSVRFLAPEVVVEPDDDAPLIGSEEALDGLHTKLFVIDRGWNASVFSGSFNATVHALEHNVEFMVELVGKRSHFGVDQFLRQVKGETTFADLLNAYDVDAPATPGDTAVRQLDELLHSAKCALAAARPRLAVTAADETDL